MDPHGGEPLGIEVDAALFDQVRTCDNHCEFCFIYQLPKGLRRSLYVQDDDYRLSFLYGNFTTLTRFTEADLERVVTEGLSPLWVSIHATDPEVRARMLRNRRGATSLRWLRALLDHGIEIHGQVVVCPGINDGPILDDTLAGVLDAYPELATVACVPLGVSRYNARRPCGPTRRPRPRAVVDGGGAGSRPSSARSAAAWSYRRRRVLPARRPALSPASTPTRASPSTTTASAWRAAFEARFHGRHEAPAGGPGGFFQSVDGAPADGYRAPRAAGAGDPGGLADAPVTVLTGTYGAAGDRAARGRRLGAGGASPVANDFFGGNIAVAGLLTGADLAAALADTPTAIATCCPTCASRAGGSSTGCCRATCPGRWRSCPRTGRRCGPR